MKRSILLGAALAVAAATSVQAQSGRDYISIVGSSTVYPFATVVAERFGKSTSFKTPKIESTGSGGGLKLFCAGVGVEHPDITNASRRIKQSELDRCAKNGVTGVTEVKVGYDGIVVGNSKKGEVLNLTRKDIFLALAKDIPNPDGSETLVPNPYMTWERGSRLSFRRSKSRSSAHRQRPAPAMLSPSWLSKGVARRSVGSNR